MNLSNSLPDSRRDTFRPDPGYRRRGLRTRRSSFAGSPGSPASRTIPEDTALVRGTQVDLPGGHIPAGDGVGKVKVGPITLRSSDAWEIESPSRASKTGVGGHLAADPTVRLRGARGRRRGNLMHYPWVFHAAIVTLSTLTLQADGRPPEQHHEPVEREQSDRSSHAGEQRIEGRRG